MIGQAAYGRTLSAAEAAPILDYFGVGPNTDIGIDGMEVEYRGKIYWLLQRSFKFPNPDSTSPDGRHTVYDPSSEEEQLGEVPEQEMPLVSDAMKLAAFGIGAYLVVNLVKAFRK